VAEHALFPQAVADYVQRLQALSTVEHTAP
jgi:hypothetical protein